jgi:hypothetical protein
MNIEEAAIIDKKFVARIREAAGSLGTAQIKSVISLFLQKLETDVLEKHSALEATELMMEDWQYCESCEKLDMPGFMIRDAEDGTCICKPCQEEFEDKEKEDERRAKEGWTP